MTAAPPPDRDTLYYDGQCGMCTRSAKWLRRLDWLNRLDFADSTATPEDRLPVPMETAMTGMPMHTRAGSVLVGYPAVRRGLLQTPLGFIPALFMYLPGVSHLGRRIYAHIAANRARNASCAVDPGA